MAVTHTNNWKNILNILKGKIGAEFSSIARVMIGNEERDADKQYIRIEPSGSDLLELATHMETREFSVNIFYHYTKRRDVNKNELDSLLLFISRFEALIHDNVNMTLSDSTVAYNCRLESTLLDVGDEDEKDYVVQWDWKCLHRSNLT